MEWQYLMLTVHKDGRGYKPIIHARFGRQEKTYRIFTASDFGCKTKESARLLGEKHLREGRFV